MAQFYGSIRGSRGEATRLGTKSSGFSAHPRGWNAGVKVECRFDEELGKDVFAIWRTTGSSGRGSSVLIGSFVEGDKNVTISPECNPVVKEGG